MEAASGTNLELVTNGDEAPQNTKLDALGIADAFDTLVFVDPRNGVPPKPDAAPFEKALTELGTTPNDALHVGDSLRADIAGANALGMDSVWVPHDERAMEPTPNRRTRSPRSWSFPNCYNQTSTDSPASSNASSADKSSWTTPLTARAMASGSSCWKTDRPMETPAAARVHRAANRFEGRLVALRCAARDDDGEARRFDHVFEALGVAAVGRFYNVGTEFLRQSHRVAEAFGVVFVDSRSAGVGHGEDWNPELARRVTRPPRGR